MPRGNGNVRNSTDGSEDRVEKPIRGSGSGNRGQTGLPANFRQKAPEIHGSLVSPRGHSPRGSVFQEGSRAERPSQQGSKNQVGGAGGPWVARRPHPSSWNFAGRRTKSRPERKLVLDVA